VTSDDPFGAATQPAQLAQHSIIHAALAAKIYASILDDIAGGKPAHQIVAGVRALLAAASKGQARSAAAVCTPTSHKLEPPRKRR
jgi:hypothetical protein